MTARGLPEGAAIVALTKGGLALARRIRPILPAARIHGLSARIAASDVDVSFSDAAAHLRALFAAGTPIVAVCSAGIVIRALARLLAEKSAEPPVLALAEDGSCAVPLLGGHRGANAVARVISEAIGSAPAITTAGDLRFGLALDAPPPGWRIANPERIKDVAAALLADEAVALKLEAGDGGWLSQSKINFAEDAPLTIRVSDRAQPAAANELLYHPPVLVLGMGCERGAEPEEALALARQTLADADLSGDSLACLASLDIKEDEPAMHRVASAFSIPARFFDAATLEAETPRLPNPSVRVFEETGCHGVAEGAALAATGAEASLVVPKTKSARVTCAIARAPRPLDPEAVGRARGELYVVGIGPGDPAMLSPEVCHVVSRASDLVGYALYLNLLGEIGGAARHEFPIGAEEERCRKALDLAAGGRRVALVCSGDAGIYGLASLVLELIDSDDRADWNRIALEVMPGISAVQAAAAKAGAPINHDFCAISLSDLLTPWAEIERRLEAAAAGDFAVALYNPASKRRRDQLARARDILLAARPPQTPVVLARNLGRPGESLTLATLEALSAADIDMLTLVLVGNSQTRVVTRAGRTWIYTPRGYRVAAAAPKKRGRS